MDTKALHAIFQTPIEPEFDFGFSDALNRSSCQNHFPEIFDDVPDPELWTMKNESHFEADPIYPQVDQMGNPGLHSPISAAPQSILRDCYSVPSTTEFATPPAALPTQPFPQYVASRSNARFDEMLHCPHPGCSRTFRRHKDLLFHNSNFHSSPKYPCTVLGCKRSRKAFYRADNLRRHMRMTHSMDDESMTIATSDKLHSTTRICPPETAMVDQILLTGQESQSTSACHDSTAVSSEKWPLMIFPNIIDTLEVTEQPKPKPEQGQSLDQQGIVDGNEKVGSFEMTDAQDDKWKELPTAKEQTTPCGENIRSNKATGNLAEQLSFIESPSERFVGDLFQEYDDQISLSPASSFTSHGSENTRSSSSSSSNVPTQPYSHGTPRKRAEKNSEEEENEESRGYKKPKLSLSRGSQNTKTLGRRLACPFHIFDSEKYCKNGITGIKYNSCSGPGFLAWHYLKQHLGKSQSAVHIKIRCPTCLAPFKTADAVLQHLESQSSKCSQDQTRLVEDDIEKQTWTKIDQEVSMQGFAELPQLVRQSIDDLVSRNLVAYAPEKPIETRRAELRKWYMVWNILFPKTSCPRHPFYDDESSVSMTKTYHLVKTFKETVESNIGTGEIKGIDDETLEKLQECLRTAIKTSSRTSREIVSVQLPSTSPSLQPLLVPNFPFQTFPSFISPTVPRQSFGGSTVLQSNDHNEVIGGPASGYMARDFLEAQHCQSNIPNSHGQFSVDNQMNSFDANTTTNNNHVDLHYLNGLDLDRAPVGEEWGLPWDDFLQFDGSIPSETQLASNVLPLHDLNDCAIPLFDDQEAASEANKEDANHHHQGNVDSGPGVP